MSPAARRPGGARRARPRKARGESRVGERFEVEVGPVGHGGFCVARHEGRAVFVRHALPGERVVVAVTEGTDGDRFWRADAVEVLSASEHRVPAPCPYAGPDACGGCDFQHVEVAHQRDLKATVVAEQLRRLAGLDVAVEVEAVPGDVGGLGWRTRQRYASLPDGGRAMRKHRSHELVAVDQCLLESPDPATHVVHGVAFAVADGGFWQVHPGAPETLVDAVLEALAPQPGESALDLYAGVGLFSRFLADRVGGTGRVAMVEGDTTASALSLDNVPGAEATAGDVARVLAESLAGHWDVVVLDPPREGAKRAVVEQVVARAPRAVAHVACDPAALARDVAIFAEHGYRLASLRAFDLFPMTHHVECVALLLPGDD
ncbi:class I SAM-dependent RNA methyltransferase [Nocardioides dongxiaopingii]|uniref:class I SAM-dependent RNA methyltransferase n=1 Tax=Nocardioides dongxiaopingii TaxID=2576036 RepID=UPI0010C766B5|nr:TRAM domain-containing protein [Nocardioides dongxiaopingii]